MAAKKHGVMPISVKHDSKTYHLFDSKHTHKQAEAAAQLYAAVGPKSAKYIIVDIVDKGRTIYGIYCSKKVTVSKARK